MSLSQPLGLHKHLSQPSRGLDIVPLFDVLLIALMLTLLGSRFIFAPGVSVDLPQAATTGSATAEPGASMAVLTLLKDNSLIYGGRLLSVENFEREAHNSELSARTAEAVAEAATPEPPVGEQSLRVLLIKSDAGVSLGTVLRVMNAARAAGYDRVQIAEQVNRSQERMSPLLLR